MLRLLARWRMKKALEAERRVADYGERVLGPRQWSLLRSYGKYRTGRPYGGQYVSGVPAAEVGRLLKALEAGEVVPIHLMHRHQSGNYKSTCLRLAPDGALLMVYPGREVPALAT